MIIQIMFDWATHMIDNPPTYNKQLCSEDTVGNWFGLVKEQLLNDERFKNHPDFQGDMLWFTSYKSQLVKAIKTKQTKGQTDVEDDAGTNAIFRKHEHAISYSEEDVPDLIHIQRSLLFSDISDKMQTRSLLNATYSADGRGGECKFFNMSSWSWDGGHRCLIGTWKDLKNLSTKKLTFCNDSFNWETCILDSFGDYWSAERGLIRKPTSSGKLGMRAKFVFPMCQSRTDAWAAKHTTKILREFVPKCQQSGITSRSLRYGVTTEMHEHPDVSHPELLTRGGWEPADNSKHYIAGRIGSQLVPMRALAGYINAKKAHYPPRLTVLGEDLREKIDLFAEKLYPTNLVEFKKGGKLKPLLRVVLATNIKNFTSKLSILGMKHSIIHNTMNVAESLKITLAQLKEWSSLLQNDFELINSRETNTDLELKNEVSKNTDTINKLVFQVSACVAVMRSQSKQIETLTTMIQEKGRQQFMTPPTAPTKSKEANKTYPTPKRPTGLVDTTPTKRSKKVDEINASQLHRFVNMARNVVSTTKPQSINEAISDSSKKSKPSASDGKTSIRVSNVLIEVVNNGSIQGSRKYKDIQPPLSLFPNVISDTKYKIKMTMSVVDNVITLEQDKLFRSKNPDQADVVLADTNIDNSVLEWLASKEGKKVSSRQKNLTSWVWGREQVVC